MSSMAGEGNITVDIEDYIPSPDEFVAVEVEPEFIHKETPEFPRLAKQAGITGTVVVKMLVDETGNVLKVILAKSSGTQALDDAALGAAEKCKFSPAIQNGRPVKVWVTFPYEFVLKNE